MPLSLLSDLCVYLSSIPGVGTFDPVGGTGSLFYPEIPDAPPSCLALRPYGGQPPGGRTFETATPIWDAPSIQVVVRDADYDAANARANAVYNALSAVSGRLFGTVYVQHFWCLQPPSNALGRDLNNLWLVSFNVAIRKAIA